MDAAMAVHRNPCKGGKWPSNLKALTYRLREYSQKEDMRKDLFSRMVLSSGYFKPTMRNLAGSTGSGFRAASEFKSTADDLPPNFSPGIMRLSPGFGFRA
jgi:hypothetical protein